jgi:hypothetical protein
MKALLSVIAFLVGTSAFASTITLNCTPSGGSFTVGNSVNFINGVGSGSFVCSDASLGAVTLLGVTVNMYTNYTTGNGTVTDPNDNSAGFTFTDGPTDTWANAQSSDPTPLVTSMNLSSGGVTVFATGNFDVNKRTFTNTTSGGLGGTAYVEPMTDSQTGTLAGIFNVPVTAFVDAGGFTNGTTVAQLSVTYTYNSIISAAPEPVSMLLVGGGLLGLAFVGRRRVVRKS